MVTATRSDQLRPIGFFAYVEGSFRWLGNIRFGARPPTSATVKPIDMTKQAGNMISSVPPVYPPEAKTKRIQGTVLVSAVIGTDGTVQSVFYERGSCLLAPAAMAAVRQWRYKPTLLDGKPVPVSSMIEISFTLTP
jgi:TonB family protein